MEVLNFFFMFLSYKCDYLTNWKIIPYKNIGLLLFATYRTIRDLAFAVLAESILVFNKVLHRNIVFIDNRAKEYNYLYNSQRLMLDKHYIV